MKHSKFQIFIGKDGQCYFRLVASNGEIILGSEGYVDSTDCLTGIHIVKINSIDSNRYKKMKGVNGDFYFLLQSKNGEAVGKSQMYGTSQARDMGISAVMNAAPEAKIEDLS